MRDAQHSSSRSSSAPIRVDLGGPELLPDVQPVWDAVLDTLPTAGAAGLSLQPVRESWPLRLARYERVFERQPAFVLVARQGEQVIGYALAYADDPIDEVSDGPVVTLESLAVLPEMRGQGLGGWLLEEAESEGIEQWGAQASALEVLAGTESADDFYARAGFVEMGETWLRPDPASNAATGAASNAREIDDDRLGDLLDEGSELFAIGLEEGPDDIWVTSEVLVGLQPEPDYAADGAALEAALAPFAAAGASSVLVALDASCDPAWRETLAGLGFRRVLRLLTRSLVIE
ncbi:GNAT family N-acetyltransferase [Leucobacter sp. HY1908]